MSGSSIMTTRSQWVDHTTQPCPANKSQRKKRSWLTRLLSILFGSCFHGAGTAKSSKKIGRRHTRVVPVIPKETSATVEAEAIPSTSHSAQDTSFHTIGPSRINDSLESHDHDNISTISLGEARELAQLRIDRDNMITSNESSDTYRRDILPPLDPAYQKKAASTLKLAIDGGHLPTSSSPIATRDKVKQTKEARPKCSNKVEKLSTWFEESIQSISLSKRRQKAKDPHGEIAKEHAKIAMLYKRISYTKQKLQAVQFHIAYLVRRMEREHVNLFPELKTSVSTMQRLEKQLGKRLDEVRTRENKTKQMSIETSTETPSSEESSEQGGEDCSVSEDSSDEQVFQKSTAPVPVMVMPCDPPSKKLTTVLSSVVKAGRSSGCDKIQPRIIFVAESNTL